MSDYRRAVHTSIRIPIDTARALRESAQRHDRPISRYVVRMIQEGLAREEADAPPKSESEQG